MENLTPLIFIIVALLLSFLNKKKPSQGAPQGSPNPNQKPAPRPVDLETVLEEFFGKKEGQPQYEEEHIPEGFDAEPAPTRGSITSDVADEEQGYEFGTYETETYADSVFQDHVNKTSVGPDYQFGGESYTFSSQLPLPKTPEDTSLSHISEQGEMKNDIEDLDDFSAREAVIYSEIINRKY